MSGPKHIKQSVVATFFGIILNPNDLGVIGGAGAHIFISGIVQIPLGVTDFGLGDTGHSLVGQFDSPEAAGPELGELLAGSGGVSVGAQGNRGGGGVSGGAWAKAELVEPTHPDGTGLVEDGIGVGWGMVVEGIGEG